MPIKGCPRPDGPPCSYVLNVVKVELGGNPGSHRGRSRSGGGSGRGTLPAGIVGVFDGLCGEGFVAAVYEAAGNGGSLVALGI